MSVQEPFGAGQLCLCNRCGQLCKVATERNPDARILRKSAVPDGLCADCAATLYLTTVEPIATLLKALMPAGPADLLEPRVQEQFARVLTAGKSDCDPSELHWEWMVINWALPFPKSKNRAPK